MIQIKTLSGIFLDVSKDQELNFEENSKFFDSNVFSFDYSNSFDLPFTNTNNQFFRKIKNKSVSVEILSDGIHVGIFIMKLLEEKTDLSKNTGSYNVQLESPFSSFNNFLSKKKVNEVFEYNETISFPNMNGESYDDTTMWEWLYNEQQNPREVPYRFPQYSLIQDIQGEISLAETMNKNFGNIVECNWFDVKPLHPSYGTSRQFFVNKGVVMHGYYPEGTQDPGWLDFPIRIWSIAVPCFKMRYVLEFCLNKLGYELELNYKSTEIEDRINNIVLLNNYNILNWRSSSERQIKETLGNVDQILGTQYTKLSIWDWIKELVINGKNHVPNISISELLFDFMIKSGGNFTLNGNKISISFDKAKENTIPKKWHRNVSTKYEEIIGNHIFKYEYDVAENEDNIPDYVINNGTDNENNNEITSIIVPALHRKKSVTNTQGTYDAIMSYITGAPNIDKTLSESIQKKTKYEYKYNNDSDQYELARVREQEFYEAIFVTTNPVPRFCGFVIKRTDKQNVNFLIASDTNALPYPSIQAYDTFENFLSLKWILNNTGIIEIFYKDKLQLFQTNKYHEVEILYNSEEFNRFNHYDFINFLGRKTFALKRSYTLPFSKNPQIKYSLYEPE